MQYRIFLYLYFSLFASMTTAESKPSAETQEQIIRSYVEAFNAKDIEAMLEMVTNDVQWLSINGEIITNETNSKNELRQGMIDYFKSCRSCKSRLVHLFSTGTRVSALEVASYETSSGIQEQQSVSVYEFSESLIKRVYYFPAEK